MTCCCSLYGILAAVSLLIVTYLLGRKTQKKRFLKDKHVVITGGSQGIGKAAGIEAALRGAHVTILARNELNLNNAKKEINKSCQNEDQVVTGIKGDVTKFEDIEKILTDLDKTRPIDVLINCAGMAICGAIDEVPQKEVIDLVNLNLLGTYFATKAVVPLMKSRNDGTIIMTSSQGAMLGIYGFGIYSATKFALRGLAETLYMEVKPYNISVTLALPPDTDTPGFERENIGKPKETLLISESGGLFKPEVVAKRMLNDAMVNKFCYNIISKLSGI